MTARRAKMSLSPLPLLSSPGDNAHIRSGGQQTIAPTPRDLICRLPVRLLADQGRSLFAGLFFPDVREKTHLFG
jgi:hypothetical protein